MTPSSDVGEIRYIAEIDTSKLKKDSREAEKIAKDTGDNMSSASDKGLNSLSKKLDDIGDKMISTGKKLTVGLTAPITALATYGVKAFSDLNESVNAANVTFGSSSEILTKFAENAAKQVGLSKRAFLEASIPVGAALQNVGYSADEAANKSVELTKRAADMASVFNVDVSDALTAIQAGLRGEADPLERFGVGLNETAVKAYALRTGLIKQGEEMTNNQKTTARLGLLMEQTNKVQGDFVNTSDGLANSQRILKAETEDTAAKFGQNLAPATQKLQAEASKLLEKFNQLTPAQQEMIIKGAGLLAVVGPLTTAIGALAKAAAYAYASLGPLGAFFAVGGAAAVLNFKASVDQADNAIGKMRGQFQSLGFDTTLLTQNVNTLKLSQDFLRQSTDMVTSAQTALNDSTNRLANAELGLESANLRVEEAQKSYTNAVKLFGPDSLEARRANLELKSAQQGVKDAADAAKKAQEDKGRAEAELAKKKELETTTRAATEALKDQAGWFDKLAERAKKAGVSNTLYGGIKTPGFATGVRNFSGGLAVVGEQGPELVNLPKGSDVLPNPETERMLNPTSVPMGIFDTAETGVSNVTNVNIQLKNDGMFASSTAELRRMTKIQLQTIDDELRAKGLQPLMPKGI